MIIILLEHDFNILKEHGIFFSTFTNNILKLIFKKR